MMNVFMLVLINYTILNGYKRNRMTGEEKLGAVTLILCAILFTLMTGDPDIIDGIVHRLMKD